MLIVRPVQDKKEQEEYSLKCGLEHDVDLLCYAAFVDEVLVGVSLFKFAADGGHIMKLCKAEGTDDIDAFFIMGRQTMNYIDLCGSHECWLDDSEIDRGFAIKLGFLEKDGRLYADLKGFFESPCSHDKANSPK